ncbi:hypothetical protein N4T20_13790 [Flavobacterium sp. TR2]|uniref:hypothetical protein n=1 Tax=Flavobacterium sp. TR2 TaxID=2977321 RepID=UPI0021B13DB4|nr:hypothetical protein [Flavobacterium sp. TR2]UWY26791.1 hypothetical protein N4T20_13790 [Flavobacterium sp. TR2]
MKVTKIIAVFFLLGMFCLYLNYFSSFVMPWQKEDAIKCVLSWGQLENLPEKAEIISIEKRGSIFTRQFIIEFESSESEIKKWMQQSKGFENNIPEIRKNTKVYEIHPKSLQSYGGRVEITGSKVLINMSWS